MNEWNCTDHIDLLRELEAYVNVYYYELCIFSDLDAANDKTADVNV